MNNISSMVGNNNLNNNFNNLMNSNVNTSLQRNNTTFPSAAYFNQPSQQQLSTNNIIWVQGIEGAKAFQLNPNSVAIMLDSENEDAAAAIKSYV